MSTPDLLRDDPTQWFPMPAALVVCQTAAGVPNLMGIGYVGFACWQPPTVTLGINTARYTGRVVKQTGEFVVALPEPDRVLNLDATGALSGADGDKFARTGFTTRPADKVAPPLVNECAVNLECQLVNVTELGSHDLFLGRVVRTHVAQRYLDGDRRLDPIVLVSREYRTASRHLADFGASYRSTPDPDETQRRDSDGQ